MSWIKKQIEKQIEKAQNKHGGGSGSGHPPTQHQQQQFGGFPGQGQQQQQFQSQNPYGQFAPPPPPQGQFQPQGQQYQYNAPPPPPQTYPPPQGGYISSYGGPPPPSQPFAGPSDQAGLPGYDNSSSSTGYPRDDKTAHLQPHQTNEAPPPPPPEYNTLPPPNYLSLLPPPPAFAPHSYFLSSSTNAPLSNALAGKKFCASHPLQAPLYFPPNTTTGQHADQLLAQIAQGGTPLAQPNLHGKSVRVNSGSTSLITLFKRGKNEEEEDTTVLSELPLYLANYHHPRIIWQQKKENYSRGEGPPPPEGNEAVAVGYDIHILGLPEDGVVAIGMACAPYPGFRLPGWNRGSFGVHSDDGRRYCNDDEGGMECLPPFRQGERYSVMFVVRFFPVGKQAVEVFGDGKVESEVVILKSGKKVAGWKVQDRLGMGMEVEGREDPAVGLGGERDVFAAVGVAGEKGVEVGVRIWGLEEARRCLERVQAEQASGGVFVY